jgi:acyl-CoA synthetase (AMP-forming)/AMP-acid ligase II
MERMSLSKSTLNAGTLVDLLGYRAESQPHQTAYTFLRDGEVEAGSLTYLMLAQQAQAIAASLQAFNATGQYAILLYPSGLEYISAFLGCLLAGVIAIPVSPPRRIEKTLKLEAILKDSEAAYVLTTTDYIKTIKPRLSAQAVSKQLHWIVTDRLDVTQAEQWQPQTPSLDDVAFLQYTSGSTGIPKGVMVTHNNLLQNHRALEQAWIRPEIQTFVSWLPLFHDMGLIGHVLFSLWLGKRCVLMPPTAFIQKPARWLQTISQYKGVVSGGPNFAFDLICRYVTPEQRGDLDLSEWRIAFCGAEPIRTATIERTKSLFEPCGLRIERFYPCYGMAEATLFVTGGNRLCPPIICHVDALALEKNQVVLSSQNSPQNRDVVGCGHTWLDTKIVIVNPDTLTRCSEMEVGEIWVSGTTVTKGYLHKEEETTQTFCADLSNPSEGPFLRTGDLGFLQDGELFITGRLKEIMIFGGLNRYPQPLEQTAEKSHSALRPNCGAAFSINIDGLERLVIAYEAERSQRRSLDIDDIVQSVCWAIARDHYVNVYAILLLKPGTLPKTSSGKIQRKACQTAFIEGSLTVLAEWRAPLDQEGDFRWLLRRYLNPLTHTKRYWAIMRAHVRRLYDRFLRT